MPALDVHEKDPDLAILTSVSQPILFRDLQYLSTLYNREQLEQSLVLFESGVRLDSIVKATSQKSRLEKSKKLGKFVNLSKSVRNKGRKKEYGWDKGDDADHAIEDWFNTDGRGWWPEFPVVEILTEAYYQTIKMRLCDLDGKPVDTPIPIFYLWVSGCSEFQVAIHKSDNQITAFALTPPTPANRDQYLNYKKQHASHEAKRLIDLQSRERMGRAEKTQRKRGASAQQHASQSKKGKGRKARDLIYTIPYKLMIVQKQRYPHLSTEKVIDCGTPQPYVEVVEIRHV